MADNVAILIRDAPHWQAVAERAAQRYLDSPPLEVNGVCERILLCLLIESNCDPRLAVRASRPAAGVPGHCWLEDEAGVILDGFAAARRVFLVVASAAHRRACGIPVRTADPGYAREPLVRMARAHMSRPRWRV